MIRTLFIIAGSAFLLCLISFAGAAALGGADLRHNDWAWTVDEDENGEVSIRRGGDDDPAEPESTRAVAWTGGDRLIIDLPGEIVFVQGTEATVQITGPQSVVDRVRLVDGRLSVEEVVRNETSSNLNVGPMSVRGSNKTYWPADGLRIVVTAPNVRRFDLNSAASLNIQDYDQEILALELSGSGDITAEGRTRALELDISGSGEADLAPLEATDADVAVAGSGNAILSPTGVADVTISGSGDVTLTTRPARLTQDISGSGDVDVRE